MPQVLLSKQEIEALPIAELKQYLQNVNRDDLKAVLESLDRPTLKVALESMDKPTLKVGLEVIDRPTLKIGLEMINKPTLKVGLEVIDRPTLKVAFERIDRATLWAALDVIDVATQEAGREVVDASTLAEIDKYLGGGAPPLDSRISATESIPRIQKKLGEILGALAIGNDGNVDVRAEFRPPQTIYYNAKIRCRHKDMQVVVYSATITVDGNLDISNPSSVKNTKICVDLPQKFGQACVTLEQLYTLIAAIA